MPLAQRMVDPRYFGPQLKEYLAKGGASGGMGGGGGFGGSVTGGGAGQIDPAAAVGLWKMLGQEQSPYPYQDLPAGWSHEGYGTGGMPGGVYDYTDSF